MHNIAYTFSGKIRDRYRVRIFFTVLKLDSNTIVVIGMLMRSHARREAEKRKAEVTECLRGRDNRVKFCFSFFDF